MTPSPRGEPADDPPAGRGRDFWRALFGDDAPVEVELGSGDGTFLAAAAERQPTTNFLGIEHAGGKARRLAARVATLATPRVRALHADATCVVSRLVPDASVRAYHVYFPDPWPKTRHARRRLFTPELVAALARTLTPHGRLFCATDVYGYARIIRARILADGHFRELRSGEDHPGLTTRFARKYRAAGRPLYPLSFARVALGDGA